MTVAVKPRSKDYVEDGITLAFPVPWRFNEASDIKAMRTFADGTTATLAFGSGYSVTGGTNDTGGTLTVSAAAAAGTKLSIWSQTNRAQADDYPINGTFPSDTVEKRLDSLSMVDQEQDQDLARTLRFPRGDSPAALPSAVQRANTIFAFSASGATNLLTSSALAALLAVPLSPLLSEIKKGDPGGNIMAIGNFTTLPLLSIPGGTNVIRSSGFSQKGKGAALYTRWLEDESPYPAGFAAGVSALPAWGEGYWWAQDLTGNYWVLNELNPTSDMFGTLGDATLDYVTGAITGTDVTVNINKLTRYAQYVGNGNAVLSIGSHRTSDTVHCGDGEQLCSVHLIGERPLPPWPTEHDPLVQVPSSSIVAEKNDRPAIAVSGQRGGGVRNIAVTGPIRHHIIGNALGMMDGSRTVNDLDKAVWLPATGDHSLGRYNPGCGIAIDPFCGVAPAGAYPTVAYDDGTIVQYGKAASSEVNVVGCKVSGFSVAFGIHLGDSANNGDFVRFVDCDAQRCIWGASWGHTQARGTLFLNFKTYQLWRCFDTTSHGRQDGKAPVVLNSNFDQSIELFRFGTGVGPVEFIGCYAEGLHRWGDANGEQPILLDGEWSMYPIYAARVDPYRGCPISLFGSTTGVTGLTGTPITITGGNLSVAEIVPMNAINVRIGGGFYLRLEKYDQAAIPGWKAQAKNALAGGFAIPRNPFGRATIAVDCTFNPHTVNDGGTAGVQGVTVFRGDNWEAAGNGRVTGVPIYAATFTTSGSDVRVRNPRRPSQRQPADFSAKSLTGRVLELTLDTISLADERDQQNMGAGDVIFHSGSARWFYICKADTATDTIRAILMNGYADDGTGTISFPLGAPDLNTGTYTFYSGRRYTTAYRVTGSLTASSPTIASVTTGDGSFPGDPPTVGHAIVHDDDGEYDLPRSPCATVSAYDATAKTITMSANARASASRKPLVFAPILTGDAGATS